MKNLWPPKFEPASQLPPKALLEEQAGLLSALTDGMISAEVAPVSSLIAKRIFTNDNAFAFEFNLIGQFVNNYKFTVLRVGHQIPVYPVEVITDGEIGKELGLRPSSMGGEISVVSPEEFEELLGRVLKSTRLHTVASAILSLSR